MIKAQLLSSDATLNNFFVVDTYSYVPGENLDVVIKLFDAQKNIRLVAADPAAIITLLFSDRTDPLVPLSKVAIEVDALDRSMWRVSLTQAETLLISGSNIEIEYDTLGDASIIFRAVLRNVLAKTLLSGNC